MRKLVGGHVVQVLVVLTYRRSKTDILEIMSGGMVQAMLDAHLNLVTSAKMAAFAADGTQILI